MVVPKLIRVCHAANSRSRQERKQMAKEEETELFFRISSLKKNLLTGPASLFLNHF
jgi:hypothetical protein